MSSYVVNCVNRCPELDWVACREMNCPILLGFIEAFLRAKVVKYCVAVSKGTYKSAYVWYREGYGCG